MKEESILESFKQYHNANWHDGDNTFDERTYAMPNNEDFDDPFVQYCFEHYEAGYEKAYKEQNQVISDLLGEIYLLTDDIGYHRILNNTRGYK